MSGSSAPRRLLQIGDVARETGVSLRALRCYPQQGLLASPREANRHRSTTPTRSTRSRRIRTLLSAGLRTGAGPVRLGRSDRCSG
jgi:DNA-binding transcriptional MerR regulator